MRPRKQIAVSDSGISHCVVFRAQACVFYAVLPRMIGLPPKTSGSTVMRLSNSTSIIVNTQLVGLDVTGYRQGPSKPFPPLNAWRVHQQLQGVPLHTVSARGGTVLASVHTNALPRLYGVDLNPFVPLTASIDPLCPKVLSSSVDIPPG